MTNDDEQHPDIRTRERADLHRQRFDGRMASHTDWDDAAYTSVHARSAVHLELAETVCTRSPRRR